MMDHGSSTAVIDDVGFVKAAEKRNSQAPTQNRNSIDSALKDNPAERKPNGGTD